MRYFLVIIFLSSFFQIKSQLDLSGAWQGMIISAYQEPETADVFYIQFEESDNEITGYSRTEILNETIYVIKNFTGKKSGNQITFEDGYIKTKSNDRAAPKCKHKFELTYDEETEYLSGDFISTDCRNVQGKVVLYKEERKFNEEDMPAASHYWKQKFAQNYDKGFPAPAVMKRMQENFEFQPIYFDHDESIIKAEFHDYLNEMAKILEGIHDLRVKVIGHTDAVGTDQYNIGLSERRARAIKAYFLKQGIEEDKLEIDFRGEREPVDTNKTPEGKQRNRRVDFKFI